MSGSSAWNRVYTSIRAHWRKIDASAIPGERRLTVTLALPFQDSRRLPVGNRFFGSSGVALDVTRIDMDDALVADWRRNVVRARTHLGWDPDAACVASDGLDGTSLAIAAPPHRLGTAMEINEWALCAALHDRDPMHWCGLRDALRAIAHRDGAMPASLLPAEIKASAALARIARIAAAEGRPDARVG